MNKITPASDDLDVTLMLRHSLQDINPVFSEEQEMKCTMRKYGSNVCKSVLLLSPLHMQTKVALEMSQRFHSFGSITMRNRDISDESSACRDNTNQKQLRNKEMNRSNSSLPPRIHIERKLSDDSDNSNNQRAVPPKTHRRERSSSSTRSKRANSMKFQNGERIPSSVSLSSMNDLPSIKTHYIKMSEILNVNIVSNPFSPKKKPLEVKDTSCITITTKSKSIFELTLHSKNSHYLMVAFLKSSLPPSSFSKAASEGDNILLSASSASLPTNKTSSFDMDIFTAKEISDMQKSESIADKIRRRANLFSSKVNEFTTNIVDCVPCACGTSSDISFDNIRYAPPQNGSRINTLKTNEAPGISRHEMILSYQGNKSENIHSGMKDVKSGMELQLKTNEEREEDRSAESPEKSLNGISSPKIVNAVAAI